MRFRKIIVVLVGVILAVFLSGCDRKVVEVDYPTREIPARVVRIHATNVQDDPALLFKDQQNTIGVLSADNFTMYLVSGVLLKAEDYDNPKNGYYYGFAVEDILDTPEGEKWFPKGISSDRDGIVWLPEGSVEILY